MACFGSPTMIRRPAPKARSNTSHCSRSVSWNSSTRTSGKRSASWAASADPPETSVSARCRSPMSWSYDISWRARRRRSTSAVAAPTNADHSPANPANPGGGSLAAPALVTTVVTAAARWRSTASGDIASPVAVGGDIAKGSSTRCPMRWSRHTSSTSSRSRSTSVAPGSTPQRTPNWARACCPKPWMVEIVASSKRFTARRSRASRSARRSSPRPSGRVRADIHASSGGSGAPPR